MLSRRLFVRLNLRTYCLIETFIARVNKEFKKHNAKTTFYHIHLHIAPYYIIFSCVSLMRKKTEQKFLRKL